MSLGPTAFLQERNQTPSTRQLLHPDATGPQATASAFCQAVRAEEMWASGAWEAAAHSLEIAVGPLTAALWLRMINKWDFRALILRGVGAKEEAGTFRTLPPSSHLPPGVCRDCGLGFIRPKK